MLLVALGLVDKSCHGAELEEIHILPRMLLALDGTIPFGIAYRLHGHALR